MIFTGNRSKKRAATLFAVGGASGTPFITGQTLGSLQTSDFPGRIGFKFTVGGSNITVTDLGGWVISGSASDRILSIVNTSNTTLVSATLPISGAVAGQYNYISCTPTVLTTGVSYYMFMETAADDWYDDATLVDSNTSAATVIFSAYTNEPTSSLIDNGTGARMYGPVNFKYT